MVAEDGPNPAAQQVQIQRLDEIIGAAAGEALFDILGSPTGRNEDDGDVLGVWMLTESVHGPDTIHPGHVIVH